jgi:hypothetical protein
VWFVSTPLTIKTSVSVDKHGHTFAYSREFPSIYVGFNGKGEEHDARRKVRNLMLKRRAHPYSAENVLADDSHMDSRRTLSPKETNTILVRS